MSRTVKYEGKTASGAGRARQRGLAVLMVIAIMGITGFQAYWLKNNYDTEKQNLEIKTQASFRQTLQKLQSSKLKLDKVQVNMGPGDISRVVVKDLSPKKINRRAIRTADSLKKEPAISIVNLLEDKMQRAIRDSLGRGKIVISFNSHDTMKGFFIDSSQKFRGHIGGMRIVSGGDSLLPNPVMVREMAMRAMSGRDRMISIDFKNDSAGHSVKDSFIFSKGSGLVLTRQNLGMIPLPGEKITSKKKIIEDTSRNSFYRFLYEMDSLSMKDSVTLKEIDSAYAVKLKEERINIGFTVSRYDSADTPPSNAIPIGFSKPISYGLNMSNTVAYMLGKLKLPILFSFLLVGITIASFVMLYRNMIRQRRLAELKNEFISNITHELKTPIATVGVAIEALKSFNAIDDPHRTQEYLAISQNELQRLNLLVDKVLKLSMFEKKEVELKYEMINLRDLVDEVTSSMRLQIEKHRAQVSINVEGDSHLQGDRLHLLSVIFNLVDNALKYSKDKPVITIDLDEQENNIQLKVSDNGIGIPPEYREKVFEKFFRIPHGDTHNAKGYGLGLSYTAHVVKKHKGTISVESQPGKGATFVITLPKQHA